MTESKELHEQLGYLDRSLPPAPWHVGAAHWEVHNRHGIVARLETVRSRVDSGLLCELRNLLPRLVEMLAPEAENV